MGNALTPLYPQPKTKILKWSAMMKHYELYPLIAILMAEGAFLLFNLMYMPVTRDISLEPRKHLNNMRMDLLHPHWLKSSTNIMEGLSVVPCGFKFLEGPDGIIVLSQQYC